MATTDTHAAPARVETIAVSKSDFIEAWALLERLVVSMDKIGSAHAVPTIKDFTDSRRREMMIDVGQYVADNILDEANKLRIKLGDYLPDQEAEEMSDRLNYWQPSSDHR